MRVRVRVLVVVVVAAVVVAACQSPGPSPSPSPDLSSSPGTAVAVSPVSRDAGQLFAEAEAIYLRMQAEMDKLEQRGGAEELPPELAQYVTGKLAEMLRELYRQSWKSGDVAFGEPVYLAWIRPHEETVEGSLVAIAVCTDGTGSGMRSRDGTVKHGSAGINYVFFKDVDGALKGFTSKGEWVESC